MHKTIQNNNTEEYVRHFNDITKFDVNIAGGKGASLGEMTRAGIPVPEGFVILSGSFDKFITDAKLDEKISEILGKVNIDVSESVDDASKKIQELILKSKMPKEIAKDMMEFYEKLDAKHVAVRSSATSEDSASAAWAGQLDSFLNTTQDKLLENVKRCWASLFTPRAIFYRIEKGLHDQKVSVAVVVQKMVHSDVSGIAFSVHPVSQDKNHIIIEAGYGLGEAIVSGQITPDSYIIHKKSLEHLEKNVNMQTRMLVRSTYGGNEWRDVDGKEQKLHDDKIVELAKLIILIEKHYKFPCDIEWAMQDDKFYIVQSRPITTLSDVKIDEDGLPHVAIVARELKTPCIVGTGNCMKLLKDGDLVEVDADNGIVRKLEASDKKDKNDYDIIDSEIGGVDEWFILKSAGSAYIMGTALWMFSAGIHKRYPNFKHISINGAYASRSGDIGVYFAPSTEYFDAGKLLLKKTEFLELFSKDFAKDGKTFQEFISQVKKNGRKYMGEKYKEFLKAYADVYISGVGIDGILAYGDTFINEMKSKYAGKYKEISILIAPYGQTFIEQHKTELYGIAIKYGNKRSRIKTVKNILGDNSILEALSVHQANFHWILNNYKNYKPLPIEYFAEELLQIMQKPEQIIRKEHGELQKEFSKHKILCENIRRKKIFSEEDYERLLWIGKAAHLIDRRKSYNLMANNILGTYVEEVSAKNNLPLEDCLMLLPEELDGIISGKYRMEEMRIPERRQAMIQIVDNDFRKILLIGKDAETYWRKIEKVYDNKVNEIKGMSAWKGKVVGKARIVHNPHSVKDFDDGNILVAGMTRPDYLGLMKKASAFVTDEGGITCHAAIVARELKKPCVIGTKYATQILKDGDLVEVDADNGVVRKIDEKDIVKAPFELEFTRETPISMYYVWFNGYFEACRILGMELNNPKKAFAIYNDRIVKGYTQNDNARLMMEAITKLPDAKISSIISKYLSDYAKLLKDKKLTRNKKFLTELLSGFVITFTLGNMEHKLQPIALDARTKTENLIPVIQQNLVKDCLLTYDEIINNTKIQNIRNRKHSILTPNGPKIVHQDTDIDNYMHNEHIEIKPKERINLVKEHSREYSLMQVAGYRELVLRASEEISCMLDNELFMYNLNNKIVDVYHNPDELKRFFASIAKKAQDKDFVDKILKEFTTSLEEIKPYLEEKKYANTISELKNLYELLIRFWLGIAYVWVIPELENVSKETKNKAMYLRQQTENYSSKRDKVMNINLKRIYPKLDDSVKFLLPQEAFDIKSNPDLKKDLEKRSKGYIFYKGKLYSGESIKTFKEDMNIELVDTRIDDATEIKGTTAYKGKIRGKVCRIIIEADLKKLREGEILVSTMTRPEFVPVMKKASAIITDEGGITCHAAIVSRELKKPCIIGTKIATQVLKDGDVVEVDADKGIVKILKDLDNKHSNKTRMHNLQSREHSLAYCYVWQISNQSRTDGMFTPVKNILFINKGQDRKTDVWYGAEEHLAIFDVSGSRANNEKGYFDNVKNVFWKYTKLLEPYIENKKKISSINELKQYYNYYISWWAPMAIIYVLPESKTANQNIRKEALSIRAKTEKNSDKLDKTFMDYCHNKFPQYSELLNVMTPDEILNLENPQNIDFNKIRERLDGYIFFNGKLYPTNELEKLLETEGLYLDKPKITASDTFNGTTACKGIVKGKVRVIFGKKQLQEFQTGEILVTEMTSPDYVPYIKKSAAIITDEGGTNCHAAIVSRELKKPCIVGTRVATEILKTGDYVEVDADNGIVRILK